MECKSGRALISNSSSSVLNCAQVSSGGRATCKEIPYFSGNPFVCRLKLIPVAQLVRRQCRVEGGIKTESRVLYPSNPKPNRVNENRKKHTNKQTNRDKVAVRAVGIIYFKFEFLFFPLSLPTLHSLCLLISLTCDPLQSLPTSAHRRAKQIN